MRKIKLKNEDFFDVIDTPEKAYWTGFVYADGNISSTRPRLTLDLASKDRKHVEKFANIFGVNVHDITRHYKGKIFYSSRCQISSNQICDSLIKIGIVPRKSYVESCEILKHIPNHLFYHFTRGFFDGDGSVNVDRTQLRTCFLGSDTMLKEFKKRICSVVELGDIKIDKGNSAGTVNRLMWKGNIQCKRLYEWLYKDADVYLERKYNIFKEFYN